MNIYSILLVEDCPDFRYIVSRFLERSRYSIKTTVVETLSEAKTALNNSIFDLIILDLNLSDSRGIKNLEHIIKTTPNTAIVVLTGMDEEDLGIEAIQLGAQDFISKDNLNEFNLKRIIKYAIERQKLKNQEGKKSSSKQVFKTIMDLEKYVGNSGLSEETNKAYKKFIEMNTIESRYSDLIDKSFANIANYPDSRHDFDKDVQAVSQLLKDSGLAPNQFAEMHQNIIKNKLKKIDDSEAITLQSASNVTLLKLASSFLKKLIRRRIRVFKSLLLFKSIGEFFKIFN